MNKNSSKLSLICQKIIFALLNLVIFLTPFIFTWLNQELFEFNKMIFVYLITILVTSLWLLRMILEKRLIFKKTKFNYFILAFFLSQLLSTILSIHPRSSFFGYYTRFNGGLLSTISYILLFYAFLNNIEKKLIPLILDSLLLSAFLVSLYAIPEHFGHSPSCLLITKNFDVSCWVQKVQDRVFATFGQPNWLAAYLITIIPVNISLLFKERKNTRKIFLILNLIVMIPALLFSKSRSGMLGLAIALSIFSIIKIFLSKKNERKQIILKIAGVASLISILILLIGTPYTPRLKSLLNKEVKIESPMIVKANINSIEEGGTASEDIRKVVWKGAINVWKRYPIFGSGVETFAYSYYQDRPIEHNLLSEWDFLYNKAHNEVLNFLATTGIVGLSSYLGLFIIFFYSIYKLVKNDKNEESLALAAGIIAMFVSNFIGFSTVMTNLLLFIYFAIIAIYSDDEKDKKKNNEVVASIQYFLAGIVALLALILINKTYKIWRADYIFTQGTNYYNKRDYQTGISLIQKAIEISPKEAIFYDKLGINYSQLALAFNDRKESTMAAQLARAAIKSNNYSLKLNPVHLNFHKNQARIFRTLSKIDPELYSYAKEALEKSIVLSPTDAKLYYNLSLVEEILGNKEKAFELMEYAVKIKANYPQARNELARIYSQRGNFEKAKAEYIYILENISPNDALIKEKLEILEASIAAKAVK